MNAKSTEDTRSFTDSDRHALKAGQPTESGTEVARQFLVVARKLVAVIFYALRPAVYDFFCSKAPLKPLRLRETAYLDGLRGLACLNVFFFHRSYFIENSNVGWGTNGANWQFYRLPIIRLFYAGGHFSVGLFFVISGYVISLKAMSIMHSKGPSEDETAVAIKDGRLMAVIQKSLIKRWFRLFIPSITCSLIVAIMFHTGFFSYMEPRVSLQLELREWWSESLRVTNGYGISGQSQFEIWERYNPNNWTVSIEFKCSLFIFLLLLSLSRLRNPMIRLCWICGHALIAFMNGYWTITSFFLGALLAEIDTRPSTKIQRESELIIEIELGNVPGPPPESLLPNAEQVHPHPKPSQAPRYSSSRMASIGTQFGWWFLLFASLFAASAPVIDQAYGDTQKEPPVPPPPRALFYGPIYAVTPTNLFFVFQDPNSFRFVSTITSFLFLISVRNIAIVQSWLNSRIVQRLGVISYSLYLVHNSIAYSLLQTIIQLPTLIVPSDKADMANPLDASNSAMASFYTIAATAAAVLGNLGGTIWVADVFERLVDAPAIRLAGYIERTLNS